MKVTKYVIRYHYSDGMGFLSSSLFDSFEAALSQLVFNFKGKDSGSSVLDDCDGVQINRIEFEL